MPGKTGFRLFCLCCTLAASAALADERIFDTSTERPIARHELLQRLQGKDFILLGELHDNRTQHAVRGDLIAEIRPAAVVAEHLNRGQFASSERPHLAALEAGGFDATGWRWPMHDVLFGKIIDAGIPLIGGNLPKSQVRQVVRAGESALPQELAGMLKQFPLSDHAVERLDRDLYDGHCGQLQATMLPGLRLAQRLRDAAMAASLAERSGTPIVLVAGNGHVRRDYGVPSLLSGITPQRTAISIGFIEDAPELSARLPQLHQQYDYVWVTPPAERDDPCLALRRSTPASR